MNIGVGWALLGDWSYPTAIRFGTGRVEELAEACAKIGIARPLLITDPGLAESDMVQNALSLCTDAGLPAASFSDVAANPVSANVADAVAVADVVADAVADADVDVDVVADVVGLDGLLE